MMSKIFRASIISIAFAGILVSTILLVVSHHLLGRPVTELNQIIFTIIISGVFSSIFGYIIINRITNPLKKLLIKAEKIKNTGSNGVTIGKYQFREFKLLDEALDEIVYSLKERNTNLKYRDAILSSIGYASERFLNARFGDSRSSVLDVLQSFGESTGVDRVYVFENTTIEDKIYSSQIWEWVNKDREISEQINNKSLINMDLEKIGFKRWIEKLKNGEVISGNVKDFPSEERELLISQEIVSLLVVPIFVEDNWWGFLGFDDCNHFRDWGKSELEILHAAAGLIGAFTQRKRTEGKLRDSEYQLRTIMDNVQTGIIVVDFETLTIEDINPSGLEVLKYDNVNEIIGKRCSEVIIPEYDEECSCCKRFRDDESKCKKVVNKVCRIITKDGEERRCLKTIVLVKIHGKKKLIESFIDLTERLKIEDELKNMEATLRQSQKLSSLGQLAAGVAHEINNPIGGIINFAYLVRDEVEEGSLEFLNLTKIIEQGHRIGKIANDLLSFARDNSDERTPTDMVSAFEGALSLMGNSLEKQDIELVLDFEKDLPLVNSNKNKLIQVFINLITNSAFTLNEKFPIGGENKKIIVKIFKNKNFVCISFRDLGKGIPSSNLEYIFDPFYTTKEKGEGTGLGLSVSYGIIKSYNGDIAVNSLEGEFTEFTINLPAIIEDDNN